MKCRLVLTKYNNIDTFFLFEDEKLAEIFPCDTDSIVGNMYIARVKKVVTSINAAFLDYGGDDMLYYSIADNADRSIFVKHTAAKNVPCEGDLMVVQVDRDASSMKKAMCSSNLTVNGQYVIINRSGTVGVSHKIKSSERAGRLKNLVQKIIAEQCSDGADSNADASDISDLYNFGAVIRTSAEAASDEDISKETIKILCELRDVINSNLHSTVGPVYIKDARQSFVEDVLKCGKYEYVELVTDTDFVMNDERLVYKHYEDEYPIAKAYSLSELVSKAMHRIHYLKSGGSIVIDRTEAMTVIDVNTGKAISGKDTEKQFLKVNVEAARKIAELMRLRNISGIIIVDFVSMKKAESYEQLIACLREELSKDRIKATYVDTTKLGLAELTRVKRHRPLDDYFKAREK